MNSPNQVEQENQGMDVDEAVESQPEEPEIRSGKKREDISGEKSGIKKVKKSPSKD